MKVYIIMSALWFDPTSIIVAVYGDKDKAEQEKDRLNMNEGQEDYWIMEWEVK